MLIKGHYFVVLVVLLLVAKAGYTSEITDIIQPVTLVAGKQDTFLVSDFFYAKEYNLKFDVHPDIYLEYNENSNKILLKPRGGFEGPTAINFTLGSAVYQIPVLSTIGQKHRFSYTPKSKPERRMNLMGNFNNWNRNALPMQDEDGDGEYTVEVALEPGQYLHQFVFDDKEFYDPENPEKVDNGFGGFNSVINVPPKYDDIVFLHVLGFNHESGVLTLDFFYEQSGEHGKINKENLFALLDNQALLKETISTEEGEIQIKLPTKDLSGEKVVRLVVGKEGRASNMQTIRLFDGRPVGGSEFNNWQDAIIYSLMVDRFADGDRTNSLPVLHDSLSSKANYLGGDLAGIIAKIEAGYFKELGVNTLWISPVNENTNEAFREWPEPHRYFTGYHGYWPTHHQKVEDRFGDIELFKKLVATAHDNNMKVLIDFIANHTHKDHPYFRQHRDWFGTFELPDGRKNMRLWDEFRLTTWFEPFLPSFDYINSKAAVDSMTDNAIWWLTEMKLDGFRHDAVKHVPNSFWRTLTRKIYEQVEIPEKRRVLQIGETFGSYGMMKSYINPGQLNSQFNFNLYDVALAVFLNADGSFKTLAGELEKSLSTYGTQNLMGNVMSSHDKTRYMSYVDNDIALNSSDSEEIGWNDPPVVDNAISYKKAMLYYAYMFAIPGLPVIYYGDEFGMTGAADPDNRRMMRFGDQLNKSETEMLGKVSSLTKLREQHSALRYGDFQSLVATESIFVLLRSDMHERVLVAINKSEVRQEVNVSLQTVYGSKTAINLLDGNVIPIARNQLSLKLPALSYKYFLISN